MTNKSASSQLEKIFGVKIPKQSPKIDPPPTPTPQPKVADRLVGPSIHRGLFFSDKPEYIAKQLVASEPDFTQESYTSHPKYLEYLSIAKAGYESMKGFNAHNAMNISQDKIGSYSKEQFAEFINAFSRGAAKAVGYALSLGVSPEDISNFMAENMGAKMFREDYLKLAKKLNTPS